MSKDEILEALRDLIVEVADVDPATISPEKSFRDDLGVDSIEKIEILFDADDRFGISIPDEEAKSMATVGDVIEYVASHQG